MNISDTRPLSLITFAAMLICGFADHFVDHEKQNEYKIVEECPDLTFDLDQWKISKIDSETEMIRFYIEHVHDEKLSQELYWNAGGPDLSEVIELTPNHIIIVYRSESSGTSIIINTYRGLIFDIDELIFMGDFPYKYENQSDPDYKLTQPEWTLQNDTLHVRDVNEGIDSVLEL